MSGTYGLYSRVQRVQEATGITDRELLEMLQQALDEHETTLGVVLAVEEWAMDEVSNA